jgi:hypothetical protein
MMSYKIYGDGAEVRIIELEQKVAQLESELQWYHKYADKLQDRLIAIHLIQAQLNEVLDR